MWVNAASNKCKCWSGNEVYSLSSLLPSPLATKAAKGRAGKKKNILLQISTSEKMLSAFILKAMLANLSRPKYNTSLGTAC